MPYTGIVHVSLYVCSVIVSPIHSFMLFSKSVCGPNAATSVVACKSSLGPDPRAGGPCNNNNHHHHRIKSLILLFHIINSTFCLFICFFSFSSFFPSFFVNKIWVFFREFKLFYFYPSPTVSGISTFREAIGHMTVYFVPTSSRKISRKRNEMKNIYTTSTSITNC